MSGYGDQQLDFVYQYSPRRGGGSLRPDEVAALRFEAMGTDGQAVANFVTGDILKQEWVIKYPTTGDLIDDLDAVIASTQEDLSATDAVPHAFGRLAARSLGACVPVEPCRFDSVADHAQAVVTIANFFAHARRLPGVSPELLAPDVYSRTVAGHQALVPYSDGQHAFDTMSFIGDGR